ncbi:MAG: hypothetical protein ACO1Q7_14900 [Gemmatimonas sp.]
MLSLTTDAPAGTAPQGRTPEEESILAQARAEANALLARLRVGRASVENSALREVKHMQDKLRLVSSTTEVAAMNIMDSCDRALSLVDDLETIEATQPVDPARVVATRNTLRDELYAMMGALQFQDITAQQLAHAAGLLDEAEKSMEAMSRLFDPTQAMEPLKERVEVDGGSLAYDANATTSDREERQAIADEIFTTDARAVS